MREDFNKSDGWLALSLSLSQPGPVLSQLSIIISLFSFGFAEWELGWSRVTNNDGDISPWDTLGQVKLNGKWNLSAIIWYCIIILMKLVEKSYHGSNEIIPASPVSTGYRQPDQLWRWKLKVFVHLYSLIEVNWDKTFLKNSRGNSILKLSWN